MTRLSIYGERRLKILMFNILRIGEVLIEILDKNVMAIYSRFYFKKLKMGKNWGLILRKIDIYIEKQDCMNLTHKMHKKILYLRAKVQLFGFQI